MKPSVVTALSIAAVLGAGALAAAANLRVFAGPGNTIGAATAAATPGPDGAVEEGPGETQLFQVGPAGTVTVSILNGVRLWATDAAPGWRAARQAGRPGTVVVRFTSAAGGDLTATAAAHEGRIRVTVTGAAGEDPHPGRTYDEAGPGADDD